MNVLGFLLRKVERTRLPLSRDGHVPHPIPSALSASCFTAPCVTFVLQECGVTLEDFSDFKEGDVLQCFTLEEIERTL